MRYERLSRTRKCIYIGEGIGSTGGIFMAIDPICKMTVDEKTAKFTSEYKGKKYYFCAPGCKKKFEADPTKYS